MNNYTFDVVKVFDCIANNWNTFMANTHASKCIVGISGGIDSTCVAALGCRIFGVENVIGISLPCNGQKDADDVDKVFDYLKIKRFDFDIGDTFYSVLDGLSDNGLSIHPDTNTNLPARLRMASLYAFSQSIPGSMVINTCNLSEDILGWNTFGGDNIGSYAPIRWLTKSEVRKLAKWLDVPNTLIEKTPIDGLQPLSDEEKFGFSYTEFDNYVRTGNSNFKFIEKVKNMYLKNKFKLDIVNLPGPYFNFPNYILN